MGERMKGKRGPQFTKRRQAIEAALAKLGKAEKAEEEEEEEDDEFVMSEFAYDVAEFVNSKLKGVSVEPTNVRSTGFDLEAETNNFAVAASAELEDLDSGKLSVYVETTDLDTGDTNEIGEANFEINQPSKIADWLVAKIKSVR